MDANFKEEKLVLYRIVEYHTVSEVFVEITANPKDGVDVGISCER